MNNQNICVKELVPDDWITKEGESSVMLWYSNNRGNHNRKAFTFPKEIILDKLFAEAVGLIIGDGDMHRREKRHLIYCSRDTDIAAFVLTFLKERLYVAERDITLLVQYRNIEPNIKDIAEHIGFEENRILKRFSKRHHHPTINIQVNGAVFRLFFEKIINSFLSSDFLSSEELRRGFIRGLFAAEGCVGIRYKESFINQISFTLAVYEENIVGLLHKVLSLECIDFKTVTRKNSIETIIQNWQNYLRLWQIGLFDRCERKKKAFLSIAKRSKVYATLSAVDRNKLSKSFTQKDLAEIIGSWQGNVCRAIQGRFLFSLRQIETLNKRGMDLKIQKLRIGNLTELPYSEEALELFS